MLKLKEIAKLANVSPATVSLVLNSRAGVSDEKRAYILQLLQENGYRINPPKTERKRRIRFLKYYKHSYLVNGNPGFVNQIVDAVEGECRARNINLMITSADINSFGRDEIVSMLKNDSVDGLIMLGTELQPEDMKVVEDIRCPVVVVDNSLEYAPYSCVTMNNATAIRNVVIYLNSIGHRRIGFLANSIPACNCDSRRKSYVATMDEIGLGENKLIFDITPSLEGAYEDTLSLLEQGVRFPAALVANNDCIALGAMRAFQQFGIRIPEDISIFGFDGIDFSAVSNPPLSTNKVSCEAMGIWAVQLLCSHIESPQMPPIKIHVNTSLLLRDSVIPYRASGDYHPSVLA